MSPHSPGANCEHDDSEGALNSLMNFVTFNPTNVESTIIQIDVNLNIQSFKFTDLSEIAIYTHAYLAGYMAKKIFRRIGSCIK